MAQSNKEKSYPQINGENEVQQNGTVPKKLLLVTEQWSQEENCIADEIHQINNCPSSIIPQHQAAQNNNFITEKSNLSCTDEKYCFYHKFPMKVNNNVYPEMILMKKDAMEEYFEQNAAGLELGHIANGSNTPEKQDDKTENSQDQINALNGDDDDEDNGCIYTYKGDNYESNLSQLLDTCFSCGLPISVRAAPPCGAVSIQRILNGSSRVKSNQNGSLYSPEMDFLEMDFDPGSCGEGADSECEDNSILNTEDHPVDIQVENSAVSQTSNNSSNIQNISSLMCRRCEMCYYNEQKVNNTSDSSIHKSIKSDINVGINKICQKESNSEVHQDASIPVINNYECNSFKTIGNTNSETHPDVSNLKLQNNYDSNSFKINSAISQTPDDISNLESQNNYDCNSFKTNCDPLLADKSNLKTQNNYDSNSFKMNSSNSEPQHSNISNIEPLNNYDCNSFKPHSSNVTRHIGKLSICDDNIDKDSIENNLNFVDEYEKFSDEGEDADDERDDSVSEHCEARKSGVEPENSLSNSTKEGNNIQLNNDLRPKHSHPSLYPLYSVPNKPNVTDCGGDVNTESFSHIKSSLDYDIKVCNSSHKINNNLGSISAPEVSPTKEYSCVDKFTRSFSFHNQLSSPKYENVCIAIRHKENIANCDPDGEGCLCSCTSVSNELEACANRLSQRVKSVFNVEALSCNTKECYDRVPAVLNSTVEKVMIWTEFQAAYRQVVQVDTSACGATALLNVLLALDESRPVNEVTLAARTRQRAENAPLVEYLLSRSNAGATHEDLIRGVDEISKGSIASRFFHMFPKRSFQLSRWLSHWIKKGGVPVATLNLQVGVYPLQTIPDAWHHQMVFGVGPLGVYLTNPLECVSVTLLAEQLCSSSVLLVRRADIVSRWNNKDQLITLSLHSDNRWNEINVLGQVVGVLKEETSPEKFQGRRHLTSHVTIPAAYQSGVTIFMRSDNSNVDELKSVPELPLLDEEVL